MAFFGFSAVFAEFAIKFYLNRYIFWFSYYFCYEGDCCVRIEIGVFV